jgi:hypothetical protein
MVRAAFDQQGAILNSLQADMRVVRDAVMKLEAKEVIQRVDTLENNQRLTDEALHDLRESAEHRQAVLRRLEALERVQTEATGMARLARWLWIGFTALSAGGLGVVLSKFFGVGNPNN